MPYLCLFSRVDLLNSAPTLSLFIVLFNFAMPCSWDEIVIIPRRRSSSGTVQSFWLLLFEPMTLAQERDSELHDVVLYLPDPSMQVVDED